MIPKQESSNSPLALHDKESLILLSLLYMALLAKLILFIESSIT